MDADQPSPLAGARPGERWVLRVRLGDGSASDVIGWLEQVGRSSVEIAVSATESRRLDAGSVIVARRVPAAAGGPDPRRTPAAELERIALPGWLADSEPLGEWTLRRAGGFTGRANSCLAVGDPGVSYAAAAARIRSYADEHGIAPLAQVVAESAEERQLRALGWVEAYVPTAVLAARLADFLGERPSNPGVTITEDLHEDWVAAYHRSRPNDAEPRLLRRILDGRPPRAFAAAAGDSDAEPGVFAIGRGHLERDWLGLASVWVRTERRRQRWGTAIMTGLGHWAARRGARYVYLQVAEANSAAVTAYERLGFRRHHGYRYLVPYIRRD